MSWQKEVARLNFVPEFDGGTESTRGHLNEVVDKVNKIIQEAQRQAEKVRDTPVLLYVNENGAAVKYNFSARKAQTT